jgi:hypothetical protein
MRSVKIGAEAIAQIIPEGNKTARSGSFSRSGHTIPSRSIRTGGDGVMMIGQSLSNYAFVPREYAAESFFAHDFAFADGRKIGAQNIVPDIFSLMRSLVVVVRHPSPVDVVELINAQAKEAIQTLMFVCPNIALTKSIGLRRAWWNLQASHTFQLPECFKYLPEFLVSVMNQEFGLYTNSIEPHRRAANLNLKPIIIGVIQ